MNGLTRAGIGAATAVAVALLTFAASALAGYQHGAYAGTSEQTEAVNFRAGEEKVRKLTTLVYAECADATRQKITVEKGRTEIVDDKFALELEGAADLKVTVAGRLRGERAAGRIEASVRPPGTTCKADLRWTASLTKGPKT
jgi:hypothetical protein